MSPEPGDAVADLVEPALRAALGRGGRLPFVLGLCGAQGGGKSTVAVNLQRRLTRSGLAAAVLSLDDLYLPRAERARLAAEIHPMLAVRGVPGTHDVDLGLSLIGQCGEDGVVSFPRFDKAADDRAPPDRWDQVRGPLDVLLFEGWCVGARPQAPADLATPVNDLERSSDPDGTWRAWVDAQLAGRYRPLFARVDLLALLAAPDFSVVERWRGEQEAELRERLLAEGRPDTTQSDTELRRFIQHYERLTRHILAEMPGRADVVVRLDGARRPAPYPTS